MFEEEDSAIKINLIRLLKWPKMYYLVSGIFLLGFGCLVYGLWSLARISNLAKTSISTSAVSSPQEASVSAFPKKIYIDVGGAVKKPGIYELDQGSRVSAALEKAGGFNQSASADFISSQLNLAKKLEDEEKVYIYSQGEFQSQKQKSLTSSLGSVSVVGAASISINTASQSELESLNGVGEKRATDIINARPYASIEELISKEVLSETIFNQNENRLTL